MRMSRTMLVIVALASTLILEARSAEQRFALTSDAACTTIQLDAEGSPIGSLTRTHQGGTGLCSAHAAAILIDDYRVRTRNFSGLPTSPTALFYQYQHFSKRFRNLDESASQILDNAPAYASVCVQPEITWLDRGSSDLTRGLSALQNCYVHSFKGGASSTQAQSRFESCLVQSSPHGQAYVDAYRRGPLPDLFQSLSASGFSRWMSVVVGDLCRDTASLRYLPKVETSESLYTRDRYARANSINSFVRGALESNRPVGLGFCRKVLSDIDAEGIDSNGKMKEDSASCGAHFAVVTGRRLLTYRGEDMKPKTICQYLVRDSFGEDCTPYPDDPTSSPRQRCHRGSVWVDENALLLNSAQGIRYPAQ